MFFMYDCIQIGNKLEAGFCCVFQQTLRLLVGRTTALKVAAENEGCKT